MNENLTALKGGELNPKRLKGNSFGGIMVIEEDHDFKPLFEYKKFTKDGSYIFSTNSGKLDNIHYFVIDGQQRLQEKQNDNSGKTIIDNKEYSGNRYYTNDELIELWNGGGYKIFFRNWAVVYYYKE